MDYTVEEVSGLDVARTFHSRRATYPQTGDYPFVIENARELARIKEAAAEFCDQSVGEIVSNAADVDLPKLIGQPGGETEYGDRSTEELFGSWPGEVIEKGAFAIHRYRIVAAAEIKEPWQLPAAVRYGGWNGCPEPAVHCAFHRKWQAEFGSQIVGMSGDTIECVVSQPPRDQAAAIQLAWEQYSNCGDIVDQGCGSVAHLAATLLNSTYWFFWWD